MGEHARSRDWTASASAQVGMNVLGLGLVVIGIGAYGAVYSAVRGSGSVEVSGVETLLGLGVTLVVTLVLMVLHEFTHGMVVRRFGGVPTYGAMMMGKVMPVLYCTSEGQQFTRGQFLVILLAPLVVLGLACAVLVAVLPWGGWLVLPAAVHLGGCVGDLWMAAVVLRLPSDTRVEDRKAGMRFHPAA